MPPTKISSNRCNVCFYQTISNEKQKLYVCSKCDLIRYCGFEHQSIDWPIHKDFCRAACNLKKKLKINHVLDINGTISSRKDFEKAAVAVKCYMRLLLGRNLENFEDELISFPKCCNLCFSYKICSNYDCSNCKIISYCSLKHKQNDFKKHDKICQQLKIFYNFFYNENFTIKFNFQKSCNLNFKTHLFDILRNSCENSIELPKIPQNLNEFQSFFIASTYSCVATIIYGLTKSNSSKFFTNQLTMFIVGAENELFWFSENHIHFFFVQLTNVKLIKIYFIGPELLHRNAITYKFELNGGNHLAKLEFYSITFEEFIKRNFHKKGDVNSPSIIVTFNCGFSEFAENPVNKWQPAIEEMLNFKNIPILFTSYTKNESYLDLKEFHKIADKKNCLYEILIQGEENPYKDYRPFRNWEISDENDSIYYRNGYLHLIRNQGNSCR